MKQGRKSVSKLQKSALKKCTQWSENEVHVWCTSAEYIALCYYFDAKPEEYYTNKVKIGDCSSTTHYIHVKKFKDVFPKNEYGYFK